MSETDTVDQRGSSIASRRVALGALVGMAAAACTPADPADPGTTTTTTTAPPDSGGPTAALLADKLTFGPTPAVLAEIASMGAVPWIDRQLSPAGLYDASDRVSSYATLTNTDKQNRLVNDLDKGWELIVGETDHATVLRAVHSEAQLHEVMCDFWVNHFNVWRSKDWMKFLYPRYRESIIRPHALGRFADLLAANTHSVAMLNYLDNIRSNAREEGGVNENYARELMELHTLGIIDGAAFHSEPDVGAVARLLSGWGVSWTDDASQYTFRFSPWAHDLGPVSVFGGAWSRPARSYGEGLSDGESFVDFLAHHERTAHYIALKLCRRFVADKPPAALVSSTASVFIDNDTQLAPTLRHIFTSPEFAASSDSKVRRPFEAMAAMLRTLDAQLPTDPRSNGARVINATLEKMGQPLHERPSPDGYPDADGYWVGADGLLKRWELAGRLARNTLGSTSVPAAERVVTDVAALVPSPLPGTVGELLDAMAVRLCGRAVPASDRDSLAARLGLSTSAPATDLTTTNGAVAFVAGVLMAHPTFHRR